MPDILYHVWTDGSESIQALKEYINEFEGVEEVDYRGAI